MDSFRIFIAEEAKSSSQPQWFEKIKMPEMVGNALMVTNQYANNLKTQITESYNDVHPGRGFPLSQGFTNALSIVPLVQKPSLEKGKPTVSSLSNVGPMVYAFNWMVNQGLFEALQIRKEMAKQATKDLINELGIDKFKMIFKTGSQNRREDAITEDMVYSKKAHSAIPELKSWFDKINKQQLEPKSLIKFPSGKNAYHRISLQDINKVIELLNKEQRKITMEKFHYAGPDGFIEWIEDGPWAEQIGTVDEVQPWRTKHGISLHNSKIAKDEQTGQVAYQFGGIISPLRNLDGSYQKKMRGYIQSILSETSRAIQGKFKKENLSKEEFDWIEKMIGVYGGTNVIQFNTSFSNIQGYDQSSKPEFDDPIEFAVHLMLIRAAINMRAEVNDAIDNGESKEDVMKKFHLSEKDFLNIRGKENNRINSKNINSFYKSFGVDKNKDFWKTGTAHLKVGTGDLRTSSMLNLGVSYLNKLADEYPIPVIIRDLIDDDEIQAGNFGDITLKDLIKPLEFSIRTSQDMQVPKLTGDDNQPVNLKTNFGNIIKQFKPINLDQLRNLESQGYIYYPDEKTKKSDPDVTLDNSISGRMVNANNMIILKRDSLQSNWSALNLDDVSSEEVKKYFYDIPLLYPGNTTYGGGKTTSGKVGIGHDQRKLEKEIQSNPKSFGYGIAGVPDNMHDHLVDKAEQMIKNSSSQEKIYDRPFAGRNPHDLATSLAGELYKQLSGVMFKYGDLQDDKFISMFLIPQLKRKNPELPQLEDSKQIQGWIKYMKNLIHNNVPIKIVNYDDFDYNNYENGEVPQLVHNAFLVAGANYRRQLAARSLRREEKLNDFEKQAPTTTNKEGDSVSMDFAGSEDGDDDIVASRMATTKGVADNMANRLGWNKQTGIEGSDSLDSSEMINTPTRNLRNKEEDSAYKSSYNQNYSVFKNVELKDLSRELKSVINNKLSTNSALQGKLDSISDVLHKMISDNLKQMLLYLNDKNLIELISKYFDDLYIDGVNLLERAYVTSGDNIDVDDVINDAAGKYNLMIRRSAEKAIEKRKNFFTQPTTATTNQSQGYYSSDDDEEELPKIAAQNPPSPPTTSPNIKPKVSYGLNVKKPIKEYFSFRTRFLKKRV